MLPAICCSPAGEPLGRGEAEELAACFKALADPNRVAIVSRLAAADEVCVCAFVDELELSQPTVSHHLRLLWEAGLVEADRRGTLGVRTGSSRGRSSGSAPPWRLRRRPQPAAISATPASATATPARLGEATRSPSRLQASASVTTG